MSNKTFNMFTDKVDCTVPLPHRDLRVGLSPESHCSGSSPSLSLDSDCSNPNLSDRETNGSPDINMLDCCLIDGSTMDDSYNITIPQANSLYDGSTNLNRTFIATPDGVSVHFWNENLSNHERSLEKYHTFSKNTEDVSDSTVMSPDSAGKESQLSSCETSRRGSSENDSCSLSSGEMVIRSNSFCFEDQSVLVVSSLDESSISEVAGCSTLPSHTYLLSTTLPDVCENSTQREVINGDTGHSSLGRTFTQAELPTKEKDISRAISPISMPAEDEGGCFMTFVCEASPSDCEIEARLSGAEAEILVFPGQLTLGHGKAVFSTFSAVKGIDKDIHTSTPVQTTGNKIPNLPSFSESPCTENAVTPVKPVKQQQTSGTPKQPLVSGLHSASKFKKREIKKFPKSDFSGVKSKVVTRNVHQMSVAGCASQHQPSQAKKNNHPTDSHGGAATRVSPAKMESRKSTTAIASLDDGKSRFRGGPSPRQMRVAPLSQSPAASPRPTTLSARQRQGTLIRDECKTPRAVETALLKVKSSTGTQKIQTPGGPFIGTSSSASLKPQLNRCQTPQTTTRSSLMGLLPTPASRLPRKTPGPFKGLAEPGVHTEYSEVSGGAAQKQTPFRAAVLKAKPITSPGNKARAAFATGLKPAAPTSKGPPNLTVCPLKRNASARLCLPSSGPVDKSKPKTNYRPHQPQQHAPQPNKSNGPPDVVPANVTEGVTKDQSTDQLRELLAAGDRRFEAVAIVLQQTLSEHEEATKHCRELSQELVNLRGELVCSVLSSERLEKEKDELRATLEDALHKLQEQHQKDLAELEQKLQTVYQAEWDKVHLTYQEEADKCKALMQQQIGELKANHEAIQLDLQKSHVEELQCVKQRYETSLEELSKVHKQELQCLGQTLKEAEAALSEKIEELTEENNALIEKLSAEENRRKELTEKCQKDSQTLYLEQELDSLKVVLDIKNKQLHQQEKKLMEVDKLKEKNVKLDESLKRVQQENEDLKARMDRHAAMSRQLSTEQAVLQESLQKESKVNKRLSMENEELLWKLHNGDLSSPRKLSPTSPLPSHSFSLQSPRSSGLFSSPPVSPR
ncbi:microtubule-associated tumor suppressor 1 homolog A isoform X2 [Cheilinus undulatus]|uniref:microtubule-associated tumor suppressor 1 homolog A isoform X2 n=1 Tax=Cheilinus undulatus TaxID=241271 RepID=UPI001BD410BD|nr:microtubule-associated tumor suppressor 1 homolog A isoform X2 [Cheilinus undulatus]